MPDVVPTGMLSLPMDRLRRMLADCAAWRSWTGAADGVEALEYISIVDRDPEGGTFAIVDIPDEFEYAMQAGGEQNMLYDAGALMLIVQAEVPAEYRGLLRIDEINAALDFANKLGAVLGELGDRAGAGTGDWLNIVRVRLATPGIQRCDRKFRDTLGDFHSAAMVVSYR